MTERTLRAWRPSLATVQAEGDLLDHESLIIEKLHARDARGESIGFRTFAH
jgi:hypothetical protein